ncbi:MAG TPA: hypothetical protein VIJ52_01640 [Pseudolabrys sp.]
MADTPEWKRTLRETNALAWIALIALVVVIGISTMVSSKAPEKPHRPVANQIRPANPGK